MSGRSLLRQPHRVVEANFGRVQEEEEMTAQLSVEEGSRPAGDDLRALLLDGIPVTERRLQPAGVATTVLEGGEGSPLMLLHGGIECGGVYWAPVISRLAERYGIVVPDLPGLGESAPVARLDAATFADWFAELLQETCREKPTVIAHSLGGSLAARFATRHGDLLRRLVLYGAPALGRYRMPLGLLVTAVRFDLRPSERNSERFARWAFFDLDRTRARDREWYETFDAYSRARAVVPHVKRTMRQLIKAETKRIPDAELRRIPVLTALLWGRHDRFVPLRLAEAASKNLGWPLHVVDDVGHVPHIERPDAFLQALSEIEPVSSGRRMVKP
jgi:pimeloyl-ACP methyl ester carboxylesterase